MTYTACIQLLDSHLKVTVSGSIESSEELVDFASLLLRLSKEYGLPRLLLDQHRLEKDLDALDLYEVGEARVSEEFASLGGRMACLPNPDELPLAKTMETVLSNRSISYRIFTDEAEAVDWLTR